MVTSNREYHLGERAKSANHHYLSWLLSPLDIQDNSAVVDVGCGSGYVNDYIAAHLNAGHNLGFDFDLDAVRLDRELNANAGRILWICASAEAIPLPDSSVDHVVCRGVVPLASVSQVLAEIGRILRPQGTAAVLLHSWTFYLRWLSPRPGNWKKSLAGLVIFLLGLWFNVTGQQIQIRLGRHRVTQTFQTEFRIRRLLRQHGMRVYRVVRKPEFVVYMKRFQIWDNLG